MPERIGLWTVVAEATPKTYVCKTGKSVGKKLTVRQVQVRCRCGAEKEVQYHSIKHHANSCNVCAPNPSGRKRTTVKRGQVFGCWTVLREVEAQRRGSEGKLQYKRTVLVRCSCGAEKTRLLSNLKKKQRCRRCAGRGENNNLGKQFVSHDTNAHAAYCSYQSNARTRGHAFRLSFAAFLALTSQSCCYCGAPPGNRNASKSQRAPYVYSGIDRVNSKLGYSSKNCVPCCSLCNSMKGTKTVDQFRAWIARASQHMKETHVPPVLSLPDQRKTLGWQARRLCKTEQLVR